MKKFGLAASSEHSSARVGIKFSLAMFRWPMTVFDLLIPVPPAGKHIITAKLCSLYVQVNTYLIASIYERQRNMNMTCWNSADWTPTQQTFLILTSQRHISCKVVCYTRKKYEPISCRSAWSELYNNKCISNNVQVENLLLILGKTIVFGCDKVRCFILLFMSNVQWRQNIRI